MGGADGKAPATPQQHSQDIMAMAVVSNGNRYIATASKDKTVGIWMLPDPPGAAAAPPSQPPQPAHQQPPPTTAVAGAPAVEPGRQPEAGAQEEQREEEQQQQRPQEQEEAAAPEAPSVGLVMHLSGHSSTLSDVAVAPDEVTLASCSYDGTVGQGREGGGVLAW